LYEFCAVLEYLNFYYYLVGKETTAEEMPIKILTRVLPRTKISQRCEEDKLTELLEDIDGLDLISALGMITRSVIYIW
jgi:hypothetical protein